MMDNLLKYIRSVTAFSDESWALLQPALTKTHFRKKAFLVQEGHVCNSLFFIEKGCCKSYYEIDGRVRNTAFFFENEIATNVQSFGSGQPSAFNVVACEPLAATVFDKQQLFHVANQSHEIEALGRHCLRTFARKQEEFANLLSLYAPQQRLAYLETNHPQILQRISLTQLASFLGVARETLSRIRKRRTRP